MYVVQNENLGIRQLQNIDIDETVMSWFSDDELMKYYTNSKNRITKEILLDSIEKGTLDKNNYTFGIFELRSNQCIGTLRLGPINISHKTSDLVVLIGNKEFHGKGLAIEAIKLGNQIAFEKFDLRKLFGGMYASNISSIKAYLRAGWVVEGIRKGQYWNNDRNEDRIEVGCFSPKYFSKQEIESASILSLDQVISLYK